MPTAQKVPKMAKCPTCEKAPVPSHTPFCSKRCAEIDLHRWFSGSYAIPAVELDDVDEAELGLEDDIKH